MPHFVSQALCLISIIFLTITKGNHRSYFVCEKLRPQREQVTRPRSHSWEAAEPGQALWASATLERLLVGKPFSAEWCPWSKSHRRLFKAAKSDVNQGEPGSSQAALTAGWPKAVCQDQARCGIWCWRAAWLGEQLGDAHSSCTTDPEWGLPGAQRHQVTLTASPLFR